MSIYDVICSIISFLLGGGIVSLITLRNAKKISDISVKSASEDLSSKSLENTEDLIALYKDMISNFESYYSKRESLLRETNERLENQVKLLNTQIKELREQLSEYESRLVMLQNELSRFNVSIK